MNEIQRILNNSQAYRQVEPNGDDYPVYGAGASYRDTPQNEAASYRGSKQTYPDSVTNQGTVNQRNAVNAKKWEDMEQAKFIQNVEESSRARGQFEGRAQLSAELESDLRRRKEERDAADIQSYANTLSPSDISTQRIADQNATAQGLPVSTSIHALAARQAGGSTEQQNTVQSNTDALNIRRNIEDTLGNR